MDVLLILFNMDVLLILFLDAHFVSPARRYVSAGDIVSKSNPFACLVCCPLSMGSGNSAIQGIYEHIKHYYSDTLAAEENSNIKVPTGLHDDVPPFVRALLESKDENVPEGWESEFSKQLPQVDSIMVWDLRESEL
jgi:hypothetical protein